MAETHPRGAAARGSGPERVSAASALRGGPLDRGAYAHLLGWYLGDGHIALARGIPRLLAIFNDAKYPDLSDEVEAAIRAVKPGASVWRRLRHGCFAISASWHHWPCLFPQHGEGRKHEREIVLAPWQQEIVDEHPGLLLRGLFHSDGCRVQNWATSASGKRYEGYPRYLFSNASEDIIGICCSALDRLGIRWTRPRRDMVSVARRDAVALLDEHVGPKS
ncbi:hypothetical protein [Quadrisphaera sp. INWT6]|uniref:hypothetical protein n=1 Tax=Quadrisphaera sp. INWT6 TaxID=2596917 RepID=UPI0021030AE4|nr:hypothetical protein [Quadrisphaera sp. INWT6]